MRRLIDEKHFSKKHDLHLHRLSILADEGDYEIYTTFLSHRITPYDNVEELLIEISKRANNGPLMPCYAFNNTDGSGGNALFSVRKGYLEIDVEYVKENNGFNINMTNNNITIADEVVNDF